MTTNSTPLEGKLLPCLCGGEAQYVEEETGPRETAPIYAVCCQSCGLSLPMRAEAPNQFGKALYAWNKLMGTRAENADHGLRSALVELRKQHRAWIKESGFYQEAHSFIDAACDVIKAMDSAPSLAAQGEGRP